eukprot:6488172-Amphidinium_carterae.1
MLLNTVAAAAAAAAAAGTNERTNERTNKQTNKQHQQTNYVDSSYQRMCQIHKNHSQRMSISCHLIGGK